MEQCTRIRGERALTYLETPKYAYALEDHALFDDGPPGIQADKGAVRTLFYDGVALGADHGPAI